MGWKYAEIQDQDVDEWMCTCGHKTEDHHAVYWPLGMTLDECEFYGFNEHGGMKTVRIPRLHIRLRRHKCKCGNHPRFEFRFKKRWVDHCHHFEKVI